MENEKVILGLLWTLKKIFSRPEMLLRLQNYESVDHRLHFPGIKMKLKISCHRHFKSKFVMSTVEQRMKEDSLKEHTIQLIYSLPFNVTEDTRLSIFQYKIIHHILPTNLTLFRDSIKEHDKCHLCRERQT